jgi:hypothetical protein
MENASIMGVDLAKHVFKVHRARADGSVAFRKKISRAKASAVSSVAAEMRRGDGDLPLARIGGHARFKLMATRFA